MSKWDGRVRDGSVGRHGRVVVAEEEQEGSAVMRRLGPR